MKTEAYSYLKDIEIAATSIFEFLKDCPTFEIYLSDKKTRRAVEREFEIIGEAANYITEETKNKFPNIQWRQIIGLRHVLVHEYFGIDLKITWAIIHDKLPGLLIILKEIYKALPDTLFDPQ